MLLFASDHIRCSASERPSVLMLSLCSVNERPLESVLSPQKDALAVRSSHFLGLFGKELGRVKNEGTM